MIVIDRIEGSMAVLEENGTLRNVPLQELPEDIGEGDLLERTADGYVRCPEAAALRRELLAKRRRKLLGGAS